MKEVFCNKCGSKLPEDSVFCQYCGNRISPINANYEIEPKVKSKKSRKGHVVAIVAVSLAVISALYVVFGAHFIKYQNACSALENGDYSTAIKLFVELDGYKDSEVKIIESKFQYVQEHKNNDDLTTFEYLKDLKKQDYRNSASIYKLLYEWKVTVVSVNTSEYNITTNETTLKGTNPIYFHLKLTGGEPGASVRLTVKAQHPDGYVEQYTFNDKWEDGGAGWYGWPEGIYDNLGESGMLKCSFYDEDDNLIGFDFVMIG